MNTFDLDTTFPPSLEGQPLLAMFVTMAFWGSTLLCMQWIYAIIDDLKTHPMPLRHPLTGARMVRLILLTVIVTRTLPRLFLLMMWETMSEYWRQTIALGTWLILIPTSALFAFGWFLDRVGRPVERFQMRRFPAPDVALSTKGEKKRALLLIGLIFVVAFATTYIRPDPRDRASSSFQQR